jgi:P27 family predicted phage terminase small subunit
MPAAGLPEIPEVLTKRAVGEWQRITPEPEALGVLAKIDAKALAAYCASYARWIEAERDVARLGLIVEEPILDADGELVGTRYKRNPAVLIAHEAMKLMKSFLMEFGMTPAARSRIRIEKPKEEDPLEAFLKRGTQAITSINKLRGERKTHARAANEGQAVAQRLAPPAPVAEAYARDVAAGRIVTSKWARLAVDRHWRDLAQARKRGLVFDPEAAQRAIDFFQFLHHSKGEWAHQVFELEGWQQFILWSIFGWKRSDGTRRFRTAHVEVARKNGKSTLVAGIGLYLFFADGEPGAEVYCAATKKD